MFDWIAAIPAPFLLVAGGIALSLLVGLICDLRDRDSLVLPLALSIAAILLVAGTPTAALLAGFTVGDIASVLFAGLFIVGMSAVVITALLLILFITLTVFWPVR